jgi:hypothetical protein
MLNERMARQRSVRLLEVGCATGDFYRYLRSTWRNVTYHGVDGSMPAIARAKQKYPEAQFIAIDPLGRLTDLVPTVLPQPEIVYAKDVVMHQLRPFDYITELMRVPTHILIFRCRTRDTGATELDPEKSCQYHYQGWMPYFVLNVDELIEHIRGYDAMSEIVVYRHHVILGGQNSRYLPKACYLKEAGTAETAVGIFRQNRSGAILVQDRAEQAPHYTLALHAANALRRMRQWLHESGSNSSSIQASNH